MVWASFFFSVSLRTERNLPSSSFPSPSLSLSPSPRPVTPPPPIQSIQRRRRRRRRRRRHTLAFALRFTSIQSELINQSPNTNAPSSSSTSSSSSFLVDAKVILNSRSLLPSSLHITRRPRPVLLQFSPGKIRLRPIRRRRKSSLPLSNSNLWHQRGWKCISVD